MLCIVRERERLDVWVLLGVYVARMVGVVCCALGIVGRCVCCCVRFWVLCIFLYWAVCAVCEGFCVRVRVYVDCFCVSVC